jgi:hypothetical protein
MYLSQDGSQLGQGFVSVLLEDVEAKRQLLVAATHLKAKSGDANEAIRRRQVGCPWEKAPG